jgi:putative transcriptional regulator
MATKKSTKTSKQASSSKSPRVYKSPITAMVHRTAQGLHRTGTMSKKTMREFDELCLTPIKIFKPKDIEALRKREEASQAVFALHLGLSTNLISQWERGEKKPSGASLKLLTLVDKNGLDFVA